MPITPRGRQPLAPGGVNHALLTTKRTGQAVASCRAAVLQDAKTTRRAVGCGEKTTSAAATQGKTDVTSHRLTAVLPGDADLDSSTETSEMTCKNFALRARARAPRWLSASPVNGTTGANMPTAHGHEPITCRESFDCRPHGRALPNATGLIPRFHYHLTPHPLIRQSPFARPRSSDDRSWPGPTAGRIQAVG